MQSGGSHNRVSLFVYKVYRYVYGELCLVSIVPCFVFPLVYRKTRSLILKQCFKMSILHTSLYVLRMYLTLRNVKRSTLKLRKTVKRVNQIQTYGKIMGRIFFNNGVILVNMQQRTAPLQFSYNICTYIRKKSNEITINGIKNDYLHLSKIRRLIPQKRERHL